MDDVHLMAGLSPRRRGLVAGAALLVAALGATVAIVLVDRLPPLSRRPVPTQDRPGPVLLVPGYGGGTGGLAVLAARLREAGRDVTIVAPPGDGTGDLVAQAAALERAVDRALRDGAPSVDVVGHSAGGVVARLWVQEHDGARKARRVVTLGSPHHGARLAGAGAVALPDACPTACRQLAPGSRLLAGLATPVPSPPAWLAVWTRQDQTVTPESARLEGAVNVAVQAVCPQAQVGHGDLPSHPLVTGLVLEALGAGPLTAPAGRDRRSGCG